MCMGGGQAATITMPDTGAYDRLGQGQIDAMKSVMESGTQMKQQQLNAATLAQQKVMTDLRDLRTQQANDTSAQAARLAALIGVPPPEKASEAPVVGRNRGTLTSKGKGALRIERAVASSSGQGAGLNIT
jgi:hypothetical protein